jgi:tetratricopeptide (TPR) repeat protein
MKWLRLGVLVFGGVLAMSGTRSEAVVEIQDFDQKWDYDHPDSTEAVFRALLPAARADGDPNYLAQLLTQIARTQGLQKKFDDAHRLLDEADSLIAKGGEGMEVAHVRSLLERGRTLNSSKQQDRGRAVFVSAWEQASAIGAEYHAVDAAHMLGIIEPPAEALAWNQKAIAAAEAAKSERARGWLGSLYNNVGWTLFDQGDYPGALDMFEKSRDFFVAQNKAAQTRIAKWSVARAKRSLGRYEEALSEQRALEAELKAIGEEDGFVYEELGELLLQRGDADAAKDYFGRAYDLLAKDTWFPENEPARMARMKELGGR